MQTFFQKKNCFLKHNNNNKQKLFLKETILKNSFKKNFQTKEKISLKVKRVNCLCYKIKIKMISVFSKQEKKEKKRQKQFC